MKNYKVMKFAIANTAMNVSIYILLKTKFLCEKTKFSSDREYLKFITLVKSFISADDALFIYRRVYLCR